MFNRRKFLKLGVAAGVSLLLAKQAQAQPLMPEGPTTGPVRPTPMKRITIADRLAAAKRMRKQGYRINQPLLTDVKPVQGGTPDYFGVANWAHSPSPYGTIGSITVDAPGTDYSAPTVTIIDAYGTGTGAMAHAVVNGFGEITDILVDDPGTGYRGPVVYIDDPTGLDAAASAVFGAIEGGGIRKFIDTLEASGTAGLSVAHPDTITYPGSDYYEIELQEFSHQFHTDLPATDLLRGYVQVNNGTDVDGNNTIAPAGISYLGPTIIAQRDRPVRIKFTNKLPVGSGGDLHIPVDVSNMGAGVGPDGGMYGQNRASVHLHGGRTPWISDGTPHQWVVPAGETNQYQKGESVSYVPDMDVPNPDQLTFYYTNQQSARLLFYHDHAWGITRLNVYVGMVAGYLITDEVEDDMINGTNVTGVNPNGYQVLPDHGIPLVFQDKGFVEAESVLYTDPTWMWGTSPDTQTVTDNAVVDENGVIQPPVDRVVPTPKTGDLWYPHVYVPAENPSDITGVNPFGRWPYGPWFWPPTNNITHPPIPNPYYDPIDAPWENPTMPAFPNVSICGESFFDTPTVNGVAYPTMTVDPRTYRFRILNGSNDRFINLSIFKADTTIDDPTGAGAGFTEVKMVDAIRLPGYPATWPSDGREGGVPDPAMMGPDWYVIGSEGGFLPKPVVVHPQPITWVQDPTLFNFGNVDLHSLLLAPAERTDVLVDFSAFAGQTLIVYNDAPAAFPAGVATYDYYTGCPNLTDAGGHHSTLPGYGPNTRTWMQIRVADTTPVPYNFANLRSVFAKTAGKQGVFARDQDNVIVPFNAYNSAYNLPFPADGFARIYSTSMTFTPLDPATQLPAAAPVTLPLGPKGIHDEMGAAFDLEYGRMQSKLGVSYNPADPLQVNFILYQYIDPSTENLQATLSSTPIGALDDGTQIWKISHNGVDTHPVHVHLFDAQLINRVGWDGFIRKPHDTELGWKETLRISPLEDTIIAFRPILPKLPFSIPDSHRRLDPSRPLGSTAQFTNLNAQGNAINPPVENQVTNFGWEYVWHCHILSHEEMDMMRPMVMRVTNTLPAAPVLTGTAGAALADPWLFEWTDATPPDVASTLGNPSNEIGFRLYRDELLSDGSVIVDPAPVQIRANRISYSEVRPDLAKTYWYRVAAYNNAGESPSNLVLVGPPAPVLTAPSLISVQPIAPALSDPYIRISFRDGSTNESAFVIERSVDGSPFAQVAVLPAAAGTGTRPTYNDPIGFTPGVTYVYRVKAIANPGESAYVTSSPVTIPNPPAAPSGLYLQSVVFVSATSATITVAWTDNSDNETNFTVNRAVNSTFTSGSAYYNLAPNMTSYSLTLPRNTTRYFRVRAINPGGWSAWSNVINFVIP